MLEIIDETNRQSKGKNCQGETWKSEVTWFDVFINLFIYYYFDG